VNDLEKIEILKNKFIGKRIKDIKISFTVDIQSSANLEKIIFDDNSFINLFSSDHIGIDEVFFELSDNKGIDFKY